MSRAPVVIKTVDPETLKLLLAAWAAEAGVQPVAKELGISRNGLTSFLAGLASKGTIAQITLTAPRVLAKAGR